MLREPRRNRAALSIACVALFVALGGSVYAATKIDGHQIRTGSLPGNRLMPGSVPGNRLRPGTVPVNRLTPESITGAQIDAATLGQVPNAAHAERADSARQAATALRANSSAEAERLNGFSAGCGEGTRPFAGACWQLQSSTAALDAPDAAAACAELGGELPAALALAAFAQEPGVVLAVGDEWSGDLTNVSGADIYAVVTVSAAGVVSSALSTATKKFRCVIPLVG
jgi:hypothetical protein